MLLTLTLTLLNSLSQSHICAAAHNYAHAYWTRGLGLRSLHCYGDIFAVPDAVCDCNLHVYAYAMTMMCT
jgi:hypothetical protein